MELLTQLRLLFLGGAVIVTVAALLVAALVPPAIGWRRRSRERSVASETRTPPGREPGRDDGGARLLSMRQARWRLLL